MTFTATVANQAAGGPTPTSGSVSFVVDGGSPSTVNLNGSNQVTFVTSNFPSSGQFTFTATYNGNANFAASAPSAPLTQTVNPANTTTLVASTLNPSNYGQSVTFTADVSVTTPGFGIPNAGTVTFTIDGVNQTPVNIANGLATFTTTAPVEPDPVLTKKAA